jgi:hypothetical protein
MISASGPSCPLPINRGFISEQEIQDTIKQVTCTCALCQIDTTGNSSKPPPLLQSVQRRGTFLSEYWQLNFTQVPPCVEYEYLLVFIDIVIGYVKAFLICTEKVKCLLKEIILDFS